MSGVPPQVLAERVAESLRLADTYNEAFDRNSTQGAIADAMDWLDKLREALR